MTKNMGSTDRAVRILVAIVLAILYFMGIIGGALGIVLLVVAAAFLLTSVVGSCPAYTPLGISTCKPSKGPSASA
jgi:hypothetical protein